MEKVTLHTSGAAKGSPGPASIGVQIIDAGGSVLTELSESLGNASPEFASYEAVLRALQLLRTRFDVRTTNLEVTVVLKNETVHKQLTNEQQVVEPGLVPHFVEIHNLCVSHFPHIFFTVVAQGEDRIVDQLAQSAQR